LGTDFDWIFVAENRRQCAVEALVRPRAAGSRLTKSLNPALNASNCYLCPIGLCTFDVQYCVIHDAWYDMREFSLQFEGGLAALAFVTLI